MASLTYTPDKTRETLLESAYYEMWRKGFRAASLEAILGKAGVTKGALYYHFKSKQELGYAVVDEIVRGKMRQRWVEPLREARNPINTLLHVSNPAQDGEMAEIYRYGCPLNNLAQEMSPIDEGFRRRLDAIFKEWRGSISDALRRGQANGTVRHNIDPDQAATFMIAVLEGATCMAKNAQNGDVFGPCFQGLTHYLEALRPRRSFRATAAQA